MITIIAEHKMIDNGSGRKVQTHMIRKFEVQPEILELIRSLPLVTGVGIKNDVTIIENRYSVYTGEKVEMAGFLELGSLLVLSGWRAINANMPVIHALVVGTILNKISSCGDGTWGLPWDQIDPALQVYCIGDVKHGHIVYNTIISILLRDLFPDPEAVCYATNTSQRRFTAWFCEWVASVVAVGWRKRPFGGDKVVEKQVAKRRRDGVEERSGRHLMATKRRRSSLRTVRMVKTPEKLFESGEEGPGGAR